MRKIILAALAIVALACCNQNKVTLLSGIVPSDSTQPVNVVVSSIGLDTLITPNEGKFSLSLPVDKMVTGKVIFDNEIVDFIPDGEQVTIDFVNTQPVGFPVPMAKKGANVTFAQFQKWFSDIFEEYHQAQAKENSDSLANALMSQYYDKMKELAREDNALALMALSNIEADLSIEELKEVLLTLAPDVKKDKNVVAIQENMAIKEATSKGNMFVDFEITQPDGRIAKLSDFVGKGKYILVDFWASWCGPCRREIPNIKKVYEKYHGTDFDVVSVAVWDKLADTQKAIAEEGLVWNQIIDAQQIPTELYGIKGIPELILFGPDGTILLRGEALRGANMEASIASYLGK